MSGLELFLARLGISPLDVDGNALHRALRDALLDAGGATHTERLVLVRGVLAREHESANAAMGSAQARYETTLKTTRGSLVEEGKAVASATAIAEAKAQDHRNEFLAAQAWWRSVKEYLRTVDKDFDRARSDQADARQGNHVASYGAGVQ